MADIHWYQSTGSEMGTFEVDMIHGTVLPPPIHRDRVRQFSQRDPLIRKLYGYTVRGWTTAGKKDLNNYHLLRNEYTVR